MNVISFSEPMVVYGFDKTFKYYNEQNKSYGMELPLQLSGL